MLVERFISITRPANVGSVRMEASLGAVKLETIEFYGAPPDIYRYPMVGRGNYRASFEAP